MGGSHIITYTNLKKNSQSHLFDVLYTLITGKKSDFTEDDSFSYHLLSTQGQGMGKYQ